MRHDLRCPNLALRRLVATALARGLALALLLATAAPLPAAAANPAAAGDGDDHARPALTPDAEAAWLRELVAQSPHRRALEAA